MSKQHASKSLSFLMELLIVIFFFTIAASICVLVMTNARQKSSYAADVKIALTNGQNLIEEKNIILQQEQFMMDDHGNIVKDGLYQVDVRVKEKGRRGALCEMKISIHNKELAVLDFYRQEVQK